MKVRFNKPAKQEFLRIVSVFVDYAGQIYADRFIDKVVDIAGQLSKFPYIGHPEQLLAGRKRLYRAIPINENYRIIYYVSATTVWLVDIWDRRRNQERLEKRIKGK